MYLIYIIIYIYLSILGQQIGIKTNSLVPKQFLFIIIIFFKLCINIKIEEIKK